MRWLVVWIMAAVAVAGSPLASGSIQGSVSDATGARIPGATVRVINPISSHERDAVTDAKGEFRILDLPPNSYHLSVEKNGFATHEQDVTTRTSVPVILDIKLDVTGGTSAVHVEAFGSDVLENVPYANYDADRASFSKLPMTTPASGLSDAITMATPGVVADSNGFFHPLGDHAQVSFVVDGQPVNDQQSKQFSTQLPANAIQSMELITGGVNAEYGDKTSLVVNAQTRSGLDSDAVHGALAAHYGSFGTLGEEGNLAFGNAKAGNFLVFNSERSGRFLDTPEFRPYHAIGNSGVLFDRFDFRPNDRHAFHVNALGARNWFQIPNSLDNLQQDQRQKTETWSVAPAYTYIAGPRTVWSINAFGRQDHVNYYPSRDPEVDIPATIAQRRTLTNWGARTDVAHQYSRHEVKAGFQTMQTRLNEAFTLRGADLDPVDFSGRANVNQFSAYIQDTVNLGNLTLNGGLRIDKYRGLTDTSGVQPRAGASYLFSKTGTILRFAYSRTMETPYNENLVLASSGELPILPGRRNQFNAGFQQALGRWIQIDADYFWKQTNNAFDFGALFDTPIVFPISWQKSKIDGFAIRVATSNWRGLQAYTLMGSSRSRFFGPANGGLILDDELLEPGVFRIDHDQRFQQTTFVRYQYKKGPWAAFTWRYDNGLVAGAASAEEDIFELTGARQAAMGLYCGGIFATPLMPITECSQPLQATRVKIPEPGTFDPDHNPARIAPRHLFNVSVGTDNLLNKERFRTTLKFTVVNLTNKDALYNFMSTFSGTHFVTPRSYMAEVGFTF